MEEDEGQYSAPLLEKKAATGGGRMYVEGCPGCAVDRRKAANPGIPYGSFIYVWIVTLCTALPISSLFPFLYFMIRDLNVAKRTEDIGFYAGFVGASFMFGRCLTSTAWGMAADRIGRKPVVVFGIFSVVVFNTLFGLSVSYWMAIATRFLLGALNGLLGPIKAYAIEVCRPEHEALALSLVSTAWGIGLIIGPALGGYLAMPAENFPNVFSPDSFFGRFPYFLPCLCTSVFAAAVLISCIWMPETLHKHKGSENENQSIEGLEAHLIDPKEKVEETGSLNTKKSLFKNWPLMSSIIVYCIFSFHDMAYTEVFSLWAESDKKYGGLSFSSEDVGQVLAVTGASLLVYQLFLYPRINKILGPINSSRIAAVLCIPILFAYPYMTYLSEPGLSIILNIASVIKNNLSVTIITGTFILQNNAVPQDQRGAANGLSMTGQSFFKAVAPAGAGIVFSWAQKRQHGFFFPALPITCLFPFMYFMVRDFHIAKTEEDIGYYAGFLAASYMVGRTIAATFWGILADRIGRKPVITFSILSVVIFNTLFGLSTTYWMAITTRFVLGTLNGLLAPIKAYCIEVCQTEHQSLGLSLVNTAWALGLIVGPALGGFLAQPTEKYPHIFSEDSVFGRFPYLLPCLSVSAFATVVLLSCTWLPETIHKHKVPEKGTKIVKALSSEEGCWNSPRRKSLLQNWPWMSTMLPHCFFSLHDTAYSEILSLWALSDRKYGGLSFSTKDIGQVLVMAGASLLVYQLIIYRWVHKMLGTVKSSRVASALSIVVLATYPFMTYLSGVKLSFALYSAAMVKSALATTAITGICLLQNNAVCQEQRGTANGISTTAMSFFKSIAPVGAGAVFTWAQKRQGATFLPDDQVVFVVLNLVQLLGLIFTFEPFLVLPALPE